VVAAAAVLASVSGETALALIIAAVAMGFVAYAFVIFTREFNSAGSVYGLTGVVLSFSSFSGFEAAATLGEETRQPRLLIPLAIAVSLAVVATFDIGVTAVVANAYPGVGQLAAAQVPLVTVTDRSAAHWMGTLSGWPSWRSASRPAWSPTWPARRSTPWPSWSPATCARPAGGGR
jgi:amino acid transporter